MFVNHRDRVETLWGTRAVTSLHWRGESEENIHSLMFMLNCYYCLCETMSDFFGQIPPNARFCCVLLLLIEVMIGTIFQHKIKINYFLQ